MIRFTRALIVTLWICRGIAAAAQDGQDLLAQDFPGPSALFPTSRTEIDDFRKDLGQSTTQSFSLNLFPNILKVKAFYLEKRQAGNFLSDAPAESSSTFSKWGRYFDLLATSSQFDGKLVGEGELAYSTLAFSGTPDDRPTMSRLGLRGTWHKASYGVAYRSFGSGFISTSGLKTDRAREENEFWGEYEFPLFRLKTSVGQSREKDPNANQLMLTRTAGTSLSWTRPIWRASLSSSYSLIDNLQDAESAAFTNGLSLAYQPANFLTIQPNLSLREDWDRASGLRTDCPSAAIAVTGSFYPDVQLIGRASYSGAISADPTKKLSTMNTVAGLNWTLGNSLIGHPSLSFQVEYKNELKDHTISPTSQANVTSMVTFKVAGF